MLFSKETQWAGFQWKKFYKSTIYKMHLHFSASTLLIYEGRPVSLWKKLSNDSGNHKANTGEYNSFLKSTCNNETLVNKMGGKFGVEGRDYWEKL